MARGFGFPRVKGNPRGIRFPLCSVGFSLVSQFERVIFHQNHEKSWGPFFRGLPKKRPDSPGFRLSLLFRPGVRPIDSCFVRGDGGRGDLLHLPGLGLAAAHAPGGGWPHGHRAAGGPGGPRGRPRNPEDRATWRWSKNRVGGKMGCPIGKTETWTQSRGPLLLFLLTHTHLRNHEVEARAFVEVFAGGIINRGWLLRPARKTVGCNPEIPHLLGANAASFP